MKILTPFWIRKIVIYENQFFNYDMDIFIEINNELVFPTIDDKNYSIIRYDSSTDTLYIKNKNLDKTHNVYKYIINKKGEALITEYY